MRTGDHEPAIKSVIQILLRRLSFTNMAALLWLICSFSYVQSAELKKGPYLIYPNDPAKMVVMAQTAATPTSCTVKWGLTASYGSGPVEMAAFGSDNQYSHTITGLTANTRYYYCVTVDGTDHASMFTTAPLTTANSTVIYCVGDTRTYPAQQDKILAALKSDMDALFTDKESVWLHVGDWVSSGDNETDWTNQFFNRAYPNSLEMQARLPLMGCRGNHEQTGTVYRKYFPYTDYVDMTTVPVPGTNDMYYSFDYGPVHVAVIDANTSRGPGSAQRNWLEADLLANTKEWVMLMFHQPAYSANGGHADNGTNQQLVADMNALSGVTVDLVLCGDNHYYARCENGGVVHLTLGGGGAPLYNPDLNYTPYVIVGAKTLSFARFDVNGTQLDCTVKNNVGVVIDTFSLSHAPDTLPPQLVSADVENTPGSVAVTFDEPVQAGTGTGGSENPANYSIPGYTVVSATLTSAKRVELAVTPDITPGQTHQVTAVNVEDLSGNAMVSDMVTFTLTVYTVTFNGNGKTGGTPPADQTKYQGFDLTLASNTGSLVKGGSAFACWNTLADGTGTDYAEGAAYSTDADLTLFAKWNTPPTVEAGNPQTVSLNPGNRANPTAGADIFLDAGLDDGANATWEDSLSKWNLSIDAGVTFIPDAGSALPGISSAYDFPGGISGSGGCDGLSLESLGGGIDTLPLTLELWFKPDASAIYPGNGQILWESGGGTGLGIFYNNGFVEVAHDSDASQISYDVSSLTNEFIQVVVTFDTATSTDNFKLYINGDLKVTSSRSDTDLSGSDGSGLGNRGGANAGGAGGGDSNTESFDGQIAIFRSYHDQVLNASEALGNYMSIAGGGATAILDGTVTDLEQTPAIQWTRVGGTGTGFTIFEDASAVDTTVTFTDIGTYILRLTANDGFATVYDEVTITVDSGGDYTIIYDGNGNSGGTAPSFQPKMTGEDITLATNSGNLVRTGYAFVGWNTAADGNGTDYAEGATYSSDADVTLFAKWVAVPTYTVTYNGNGSTGGTVPADQVKTQDLDLTLASNSGNLVKAGYTFVGWNTLANGTATNYSEGATYSIDADLTLYAKWNASTTTTVIPVGDTWRYFKGTAAPPADWKDLTCDDSAWLSGPTGIGYADGDDATVLSDMLNTYTTVFMRRTFTAPANVSQMELTVNYDDGYAAYLNGNLISSRNAPATISNTSTATGSHEAGTPVTDTIDPISAGVIQGDNILAIVLLNRSLSSSDATMIPELTISTTDPITYSVTYYGNGSDGGSVPVGPTQYALNDSVTVLGNTGNLTKTGYAFGGWNTEALGGGTAYVATDSFTISDNVILYAQWATSSTIIDVNLPAGISLYGYTGESPIDGSTAFQALIGNSQLSLVRWVNPADGKIKELYYTTFPSAGWVNEIGDLTLGQGYVVKTTASCTLSITGNKSIADVSHNLPAGYSIIGYNKETPQDAGAAFQSLIDAGKLDIVRWVNPSNGQIKELYFTTFPSAGWVNEIGNLIEGQGYIIKLNAPHAGFIIP